MASKWQIAEFVLWCVVLVIAVVWVLVMGD